MAKNKQKILKNATKYTNKGQFDKAINEYRKLTQEEYGESSIHNVIGDLLVQNQQTSEATTEFEKAAQFYEERGFIPKALAIYRKILRYDKSIPRIYERLAQLYSDQGLIQDAITQYEYLAQLYEHEGKKEAALDSYRQIADLDPSNLSIRERLAQLYFQKGFQEKACEEHVTIGDRYSKRGDTVSAIKSFEQALKIIPDFEAALRGIVSVYLAEKKTEEAQKILKQILTKSPENISALTTLGRLHMDSGQLDDAIEIFEKVFQLDPSQEGVNEILGRIHLLKGNYKEAFKLLKEIIGVAIEREEYDRALSILRQLQEIEPKNIKVHEKKIEIFQKLNREDELKASYGVMAEIYYENGRLEEAYNIYERLFSMNPNDSKVKSRFNQISIELRGRPIEVSKLVEQPTFMEVMEEPSLDTEGFLEIDPEGVSLDENVDSLENLFDTSEIEKISIPMFGESEFAESADALSEQMADDIFSVEGEDELEDDGVVITAKEAIEPSEDQIREFRIEAGVFMKYGLLEKAADRLKSILVINPDDDESLEKLSEVYEKMGQMDQVVQTILKRVEIAEKSANIVSAQELLAQALSISPNNNIIKKRLQNLGAAPVKPAATADKTYLSDDMPLVEVDVDDEAGDFQPLVDIGKADLQLDYPAGGDMDALVDLTELDAQAKEPTLSNDLADVVKEFREDLISRADSKDIETHYNLGIAYKEMGLIDEAISELKLTIDFPPLMVQSSDLLALCYMEKGEFRKSRGILTKAIASLEGKPREILPLKYDLAMSYRLDGELDEALSIFHEIIDVDPKYRNVKQMIKELSD